MDLYDELTQLIAALDRNGIPYAICGGIAVAIHGYARFTRDIDVLIEPKTLTRTLEVAENLGFTIDAGTTTFDEATPRERRLRSVSKADGTGVLTLDLILAAGALTEAWATRESHEWDGRPLVVVSRRGLEAMEKLSARPQDRLDLEMLDGGDRSQ